MGGGGAEPAPGAGALNDRIPSVDDGLTKVQRVVLMELARASSELGRPNVPTVMLYGRVVEQLDISEAELIETLRSLGVKS